MKYPNYYNSQNLDITAFLFVWVAEWVAYPKRYCHNFIIIYNFIII